MIQDRATYGRRLVKQLIVGRLDMTPNRDERFYLFSGTGTLLPVLAGVVPQSVASPPGTAALWHAPLTGRITRYAGAA